MSLDVEAELRDLWVTEYRDLPTVVADEFIGAAGADPVPMTAERADAAVRWDVGVAGLALPDGGESVGNASRGARRRWVAVVAAAAAAMVLVVGLVVADRYRDRAVTEPAVEPIVIDVSSGLQWSRVGGNDAVFGGERNQVMNSVTAGGPGLVAVGSDGLADGAAGGWNPETSAAVWTSEDGTVWSRVPHDVEIFGGASMSDVTLGGPGLVAVGWSADRDATSWDGASDAAVWTSVDGLTWSRVDDGDLQAVTASPEGRDTRMHSVSVGGPGLVAVGKEGGAAAAVWTSVDGNTWSRVPHDEALFGSPDVVGLGMTGVAAGGPGLVAVGCRCIEPQTIDAAVWTSVDGLVWTLVPHDEAVFGGTGSQMMWSVTAGGPGWIAVGENDSRAAVWVSVDGDEWVQVPIDESVIDPATDGSGYAMNDVLTVGQRLVAVGGPTALTSVPSLGWGSGERGLAAAAWTSTDGLDWSPVADADDAFDGTGALGMWSVTAADSELVAVGSHRPSTPSSADVDAAAWIARTTD